MTLNATAKVDKAMTAEQFTQVVEAILAGKYSWACVLILRFAGYNPLHYIPYRTYNRLMKENSSTHTRKSEAETSSSTQEEFRSTAKSTICDLNYLEPVNQSTCHVRGGSSSFRLINFRLN